MRALTVKACFLLVFCGAILSCSNSGDGSKNNPGRKAEPSEFASDSKTCKEFIESLPADFFHDWVQVPENPFDASSPLINVFYYGPKELTENVVAFYNGGPGSDSHGSSVGYERELKKRKLEKNISFIYIDQRGNGCSSGFPHERSVTDILRARWYGSTGIVYDSEAVRKKLLGDKKWKVFGQSYGAFIVHRYASLFPESLDAAYAHANTINANGDERLFSRIYSQYRVLNMYFAVYADDKAKLATLKSYLTANKCFPTQYVGDVCGHEIIEVMISSVGFSNRWSMLHDDLAKIVTSVGVSDSEIANFIKDTIDEDTPPVGYSMSVIGFYDRNTTSTDYTACSKIYEKLNAQGITEDQLFINECMSAMQTKAVSKAGPYVRQVLNDQHDHLTLEKFKAGLVRMKPHTFYIYSGEKDTFVPKENFPEEISVLGDLLNYTHFMNSGHEGCRTEDKVWEDLARVH